MDAGDDMRTSRSGQTDGFVPAQGSQAMPIPGANPRPAPDPRLGPYVQPGPAMPPGPYVQPGHYPVAPYPGPSPMPVPRPRRRLTAAMVIVAVILLAIVLIVVLVLVTSDDSAFGGTSARDVAETCDPTGSTITVADDGKTLSFTYRPGSFDSNEVYRCVLDETEAPSIVDSRVMDTRAIDGTQEAEWDGWQMYWNYHPDSGASMTVAER